MYLYRENCYFKVYDAPAAQLFYYRIFLQSHAYSVSTVNIIFAIQFAYVVIGIKLRCSLVAVGLCCVCPENIFSLILSLS